MPGTTPVYGFPYPEPTDLVADYPALGQDLAEDIEAVLPTLGGLSPITATSIANSGGTATLAQNTVTFTGVTSVSINGVFTSTYTNYKIIVQAKASVSAQTLLLRLRASGSDNTAASYTYMSDGLLTNGNADGIFGLNQTSMALCYLWNTRNLGTYIDFMNPQTATATTLVGQTVSVNSADTLFAGFNIHGFHNSDTAFDGFSLYVGSNNITGTCSIYGYKK